MRSGVGGATEHANFRVEYADAENQAYDFSQITWYDLNKGAKVLDVILPWQAIAACMDYEHHPIRLIGFLLFPNFKEGREKGVWEQLSFEFSGLGDGNIQINNAIFVFSIKNGKPWAVL